VLRAGDAARTGDPAGDAARAITHVVVIATLGAARPERRGRVRGRARGREVAPEPGTAPVTIGRATVIAVDHPLADDAAARGWLQRAGEPELEQALGVLRRVLDAHRLVTADPEGPPVMRDGLIAARVGYGVGEQVAEGRWSQARDLPSPAGRTRATRRRALDSEARLTAVLGGADTILACEELVLRARLDLDRGRPRQAALQLLVALDTAIAELSLDPRATALEDRLTALRERRDPTAVAAQAALSGLPSAGDQRTVAETVAMLEAALRARAASAR
jgi:hypothetical protein